MDIDKWQIRLHRKVDKFFKKLKKSDKRLFEILSRDYDALAAELETEGPEGPKRWKNFGHIG